MPRAHRLHALSPRSYRRDVAIARILQTGRHEIMEVSTPSARCLVVQGSMRRRTGNGTASEAAVLYRYPRQDGRIGRPGPQPLATEDVLWDFQRKGAGRRLAGELWSGNRQLVNQVIGGMP